MMADDRMNWYDRIIGPMVATANAAEEPDFDLPNLLRGQIRNPFYIGKELEKKIEEIIQQKLSDLLLSHVCPICKKQLEEYKEFSKISPDKKNEENLLYPPQIEKKVKKTSNLITEAMSFEFKGLKEEAKTSYSLASEAEVELAIQMEKDNIEDSLNHWISGINCAINAEEYKLAIQILKDVEFRYVLGDEE
ncbi:hypothetical protein LCGC14_0548020 [marine sediment metagenome]|uniref:Uncharacterized protein n=1 Tax=marine sediment metagenome TaxID=412755 RepID=A0A0F9RR00_9ZZZZ